jgi:DNA-binding NtrC family response regulator
MAIEVADGKNRMIILVIEDEPVIRMLVSEYIAEVGFEVLQAANADIAIEILESRDDIRAIFNDITMPGSMDGLKLAHAVRDRWPPTHIIITSEIRQISKGEMPDRCHFFQKPYNIEDIVELLRSLAAEPG